VWTVRAIADGVYNATPDGSWDLIHIEKLGGQHLIFLTGQKSRSASVPYVAGEISVVMQTGYISGPGDMTKAHDIKAESSTKSRIFLGGILTTAKPNSCAIVFFGDSITDGNCSIPGTNNCWPDHIVVGLTGWPSDLANLRDRHDQD
jgi:hypothetical protein